jgi:hypothetical protein
MKCLYIEAQILMLFNHILVKWQILDYLQLPSSAILNSNSIQLSTVPDKLIVFVRRPVGSQTCSGTDSYLTITNISVNWNNQAGLLSSMSPEQLYMFSVQSGLANLSWDEFSGQVVSLLGDASNSLHQPRNTYTGVGANLAGGNNPGFQYLATTGSILVLRFWFSYPIIRRILCSRIIRTI